MTIKVKMKKAILVAAGGLAMQSGLATAEAGGKVEREQAPRSDGQFPPLQMDQICQPLDICSVPTDDYIQDFDQNEFNGVNGKTSISEDETDRKRLDQPRSFSPVGVIFTGDILDFDNDAQNFRPQMKFVISGIRNDIPVDLLIVYNDRKATLDEQVLTSDIGGGHIGVPVNFNPADANQKDKLQIIAGVTLQPQLPLRAMELLPESPLGIDRGHELRTAVVTIPLTDLSQAVADGRLPEEIYFQAIVIRHSEEGTFDFNTAQYSDVDRFIIDIPFDGGSADRGSKADSFVPDEGETVESSDNYSSKVSADAPPSGATDTSTSATPDTGTTDNGSKR